MLESGDWKSVDRRCIYALQNSHDRETCARSLRATQESRQSPGAFPPATLCAVLQQQQQHHQRANHIATQQQQRYCTMNQLQRTINSNNNTSSNTRPHRPASLDIGMARRCPVSCTRAFAISASSPIAANSANTPSSAPAACTTRGFFDDCTGPSDANSLNKVQNAGNEPAGFELNVNVACSPAGNRGTHLPDVSLPEIGETNEWIFVIHMGNSACIRSTDKRLK